MNIQLILYSLVMLWLSICAVLDWRHGEVSNWLTLPGMIVGMGYALLMGGDRLIIMAAAGVGFISLYLLGSFGGADVKVLIALAGLIPAAMVAALLAQGIWGLVVLMRKGSGSAFRAIPAYAIGAAISLLVVI